MVNEIELNNGLYIVPENSVVKVSGRVLEIREKKQRVLGKDEYRCKDCIHRIPGHCGKGFEWYLQIICEERRKKNGYYYACKPYDKPCEKFKLNNE